MSTATLCLTFGSGVASLVSACYGLAALRALQRLFSAFISPPQTSLAPRRALCQLVTAGLVPVNTENKPLIHCIREIAFFLSSKKHFCWHCGAGGPPWALLCGFSWWLKHAEALQEAGAGPVQGIATCIRSAFPKSWPATWQQISSLSLNLHT